VKLKAKLPALLANGVDDLRVGHVEVVLGH
jgi:hypothetical protein